MAQCPNCGTNANAKFCPNCGAGMPQVPPVAAAQAPQMPPQPPQPPQYPPQAPQQFQQQPGYPPQQFPPQQYPQGYPQMPPQAKSSPWKWVGIIGGSLVALLVVVIVVLSALGGGGVTSVPIITDKVNADTQAPIGELKSVPPKTDKIYAAVEVDVKKGDLLEAKWYYNGEHQPQLDTKLPVDEDFKGWGAFHISNGGKPWPAGTFKIEVYRNGDKEQEKTFEVK